MGADVGELSEKEIEPESSCGKSVWTASDWPRSAC